MPDECPETHGSESPSLQGGLREEKHCLATQPTHTAARMSTKPVISPVSKELRSARDLVAKTLLALGYEPKWQDIAAT